MIDYLLGNKGVKVAMVILLAVFGFSFMYHAYGADEDVPAVEAETQEESASFWDSVSTKWQTAWASKEDVQARLTKLKEYEDQLEQREQSLKEYEALVMEDAETLEVKKAAYRSLVRQVYDCTQEPLAQLSALEKEIASANAE